MKTNARRIECIKIEMINGRKHVAQVAGMAADGMRWVLQGQEMMRRIESGAEVFFIVLSGESMLVTVGRDGNGERCLRTVRGSLFDLPECA